MLDIKKIWGDTYLINGEHLTQDYNQAVIIANKGNSMKYFIPIGSKKCSFWKNLKNKLNFPFIVLESWM
jgi:hypothetical protein